MFISSELHGTSKGSRIPLPWGHPIPFGPGAPWSELTRLRNGIKLTCQWIRKYSCRFFLGITKYALICEHGLVTIRCPFGLVINITTAFWGVLERHHCSSRQSFKGCGLKEIPTTTSSLKNYCDHIRACDLSASPFMPYFLKLTDPCPRIDKYLEVNYSCVMRKYQTYIWTLFNSVV